VLPAESPHVPEIRQGGCKLCVNRDAARGNKEAARLAPDADAEEPVVGDLLLGRRNVAGRDRSAECESASGSFRIEGCYVEVGSTPGGAQTDNTRFRPDARHVVEHIDAHLDGMD
jgi:hypothetical protein